MSNILLFALSSFAVLLTSGNILRVSPLANALFVLLSLLTAAIITVGQMDREAPHQRLSWLFIAFSFLFVLSRLEPQTKPIVAQAYVLALLTLMLSIPRAAPRHRSARLAIMWTLLTSSVLSLAAELSPTAWFFMEGYARNASHLLGRIFGLSLKLGPTAMGLWGLMLCVIYTWFRISPWLRRLWKRGLIVSLVLLSVNHLGALSLAWLAHVMTQQTSAAMSWDVIAEQGFTALDFTPVLFVLECLIIHLFLHGTSRPDVRQAVESQKASKRIIIGTAALWVLLVSVAYVTSQWPAGDYSGRVVLYQGGITTWNKPSFEQLGSSNRPGLFCVLPDYLESFGFRVEGTKKISKAMLTNADVFVVINFNEKWKEEEYFILNDYVRQGGTLMVFADHTDMSGLMKGSNDLLSEVPIRINFDSAHFLNNYWNDAFVTRPHPINRKDWDKDGIGVSVGASLRLLDHRATPFLIARYGFSDRGNRANASSENYLGDRIYDLDEPLGDIVLAAESKLDDGKVIVFGDTALLQMGSLPYCQRYVSDLFRWAVHGKPIGLPWGLVLVLLLGLTLWVAQSKKQSFVMVTVVILSVSAAIIMAEWTLQLWHKDHHYAGPIAYLDHAHMSLCDHEGYAKDDGDTYLVDSLVRNGFIPLAWKSFNRKALEKSALMISMAATKPYSINECRILAEFMKRGSQLVLLSGDRCTHGTKDFLKSYGVEILSTPLGAVAPENNSEGVFMYNANPMAVDDPQKEEILCTAFEGKYPVVVERKVGKGKLTAISDYGLFFNGRLEKLDWASPANIDFLRKLLGTSHGDQRVYETAQ